MASDGRHMDYFGNSVAIDGDIVAIGANAHDRDGDDLSENSGAAYVFAKPTDGWDSVPWPPTPIAETAKLLPSDGAAGNNFGLCMGLFGDTAVIGSTHHVGHGDPMGAPYEYRGLSDCDVNGTLDICDIADCPSEDPSCQDCNNNGVPDECDLLSGDSLDCNTNSVPDECESDCDGDQIPDECDIADCPPEDPSCQDCSNNGVPDECDITDCPPEDPACQDCSGNGIPDGCDIADCALEDAACRDCNGDGVPNECEVPPICPECLDCNDNGVPDECDIAGTTSEDANGNDIPDECDPKRPPPPPYPHNREKNRYISFGANKAGNDGLSIAFKVTLNALMLGSCDGTGSPDVQGWSCRTD